MSSCSLVKIPSSLSENDLWRRFTGKDHARKNIFYPSICIKVCLVLDAVFKGPLDKIQHFYWRLLR